MNNSVTKLTVSLFIIFLIAGFGYWTALQFDQSEFSYSDASSVKVEEQEKIGRVQAKKARNDYFFRLLRDPETNSIPQNIRSRELKHAKRLPTFTEVQRNRKSKNPSIQVAQDFTWQLAGPPAVGGRTRALGIDQRNSNTIIAGGVSGGIWKSENGGDSWTIKTPDAENFAVTSLAQHPNNPDTWYYTSGEYTSSSAGAPGASYYGNGIFRSTDNGENWNRVAGTEDNNAVFDSQFDFINRIVISPATGTIFTANNGFGIFRSSDGNNFNDVVLGGPGEHAYADVSVASNGDLVAILSSTSAGASGGSPGIYHSTDDGNNWDDITPTDFPSDYHRSVITFAPSDPNIAYVLTQKDADGSNQGVSFFMLDISGGADNISSEDRSANLPDFGDPVGGVNFQGGYNMTISVKPDDPEFVTVGGTNLFRSTDGFATAPADDSDSEKDEFWIGGYAKANTVSQYPEQHPDQHVQAYDPNNPDRLWVGHDGGISVTNNVAAQSVSWTDRNEGYIVTQFYDVSIPEGENDNRLMGGTQDNGTPFFEFDSQANSANASSDISTGDGGFSFFTENYVFVSNQRTEDNNRVLRHNTDGSSAIVQPSEAETAFFINPYAVDPNDETVMYYPGGSSLYRNTEIDEITTQTSGGTTQGWDELSQAEVPGYNISALKVSTLPNDILYYAGSNDGDPPVIKRLDNASLSNEEPQDISIGNAPEGAFVHDIAINPANANDVLVVMSNYNITGLYHTSDGGNSWEAVEGNLTGGDLQGSLEFGPSLRSATIIPSSSGPIYMLGTSTGMYATQSLNGSETEWGRESPFNNDGTPDIGFSVIENITSRLSNGDVAVGSHGRGIFLGSFQGEVSAPDLPTIAINPSEGRAGDEVTINATNFEFDPTPSANVVLFDSVRAEVTEASPSQLTVIVPRSTIERDAEDRNVFVSVENENGPDPRDIPFTALPPQNFTLNQNYPNPFNPSTTISFDVPSESRVTMAIYNMSGKKVLEPIYQDQYNAGTYDQQVNLSNLASGVYIYRIIAETSGGQTLMESQKMTLIK